MIGILFFLILLGMAVYVLWSAITGKGKLYATENIVEDKVPFVKKLLRIMYAAMGVVMLLMACSSGLNSLLYNNSYQYELTDAFRTAHAQNIDDLDQFDVNGEKYDVYGMYSQSVMTTITNAAQSEEMAETESDTAAAAATVSTLTDAFKADFADQIVDGQFTVRPTQVYDVDAKLNSARAEQIVTCALENAGMEATDETISGYMTKDDSAYIFASTFGNGTSIDGDSSFIGKLYNVFSYKLLQILNFVFMGVAVVAIVALFIIIKKFTDKEKQAKAKAVASGSTMPSDAFNFDDDDK